MKNFRNSIGIFLLITSFCLVACSTVPITGRKQLNIIPGSTLLSMSLQQYDDFLKSHQISTNQSQIQMVKQVGGRIQKAVEQYFAENNMSHQLENYAWEFNLVESEEMNAWCMPGGKVVIYTGILSICKDEAGLAVVMGHEIAHAVAAHGNERMSQSLAVEMGGMALTAALAQKPNETRQIWMTVFGLGTQLGVMLPYSRLHENEADHLGLVFMAMAGYDPQAAVGFWERMSQKKGEKSPPEFLSTHPADKTRIENIKELIPEVMYYYKRSR
ncbi:MAG: M48 family metallopeptidase [Desulfobacterales bacterium]|nr:M48 family metallopeptidase [Desulfobacterales bacterium]